MNHMRDKETCAQALLIFMWFLPAPYEDVERLWLYSAVAKRICQLVPYNTVSHDRHPSYGHFTKKTTTWKRIHWVSSMANTRSLFNTGGRVGVDISSDNLPPIEPRDILDELEDLPTDIRNQYLPGNIDSLVSYHLLELKLSSFMASFLSKAESQDTVDMPSALSDWEVKLEHIESQIHSTVELDLHSDDPRVKSAAFHARICFVYAVLITGVVFKANQYYSGIHVSILRYFLFTATGILVGPIEPRSSSCHTSVELRATTMASQMISYLETVISNGLVSYLRKGMYVIVLTLFF